MTRVTPALLAALALSGAASAADTPRPDAPKPTPTPPPASIRGPLPIPVAPPPPPDEPAGPDAFSVKDFTFSTDQAIAFFRAKVAAHPDDFRSYRLLGDFLARKAEQAHDVAGFAEAERAYREALRLWPDDPRAETGLAAVLNSRHKFVEGLALAEKVLASAPKEPDALAARADALLELGRYDEAAAALDALRRAAPVPEVLARLANLAELKGEADRAVRLMTEAAEGARKSGKPGADAWYLGILGDFALNAGRLDEAERAYRRVPEGVDPFHDATFGLARVAYARGDLPRAVGLLEKAVAIGPDVPMLALLGDALVEAGRPAEAEPHYARVLEVSGDDSERRRPLARFLADHDRDLPRALELARKDHDERRDVFGDDTYAWCLYKNGKLDEAARAIDDALRIGTEDAAMLYHAGLIRLARGDEAAGRAALERALAINPRFAPIHAEAARKALDAIRAR